MGSSVLPTLLASKFSALCTYVFLCIYKYIMNDSTCILLYIYYINIYRLYIYTLQPTQPEIELAIKLHEGITFYTLPCALYILADTIY